MPPAGVSRRYPRAAHNERSAPPHPWNEPQTSKRRFQALASSRHINLNDLLASSFFKQRRRVDFFLPVPEIAVSPAQRLLMLAFSCLFFPSRSPSSSPSPPPRLVVIAVVLRDDIPTHSSFDVLLQGFLLTPGEYTVITAKAPSRQWEKLCRPCHLSRQIRGVRAHAVLTAPLNCNFCRSCRKHRWHDLPGQQWMRITISNYVSRE